MAPGSVSVGLLGPLWVAVDGRPVVLAADRLRALLAVLAMAPGRAIPVDRLAVAVWGEQPPLDVRRCLRTYVARLRSALGAPVIDRQPGGYLLRTKPDAVDALRFGRLLDAAAPAAAGGRRELLGEALALWRGEPFEDVRSAWLQRAEAPALVERYLTAVEQHVDLGCAGDFAVELGKLATRFPYRESLWARLLVVMRHSGRSAEALALYDEIRGRLADDLGVDPGPELCRIHAELLNVRQDSRAARLRNSRWR